MGLDVLANSFENRGDLEVEQGRIGPIVSLVSCDRVWASQNNVFSGFSAWPVRAVAYRVRGAKERNHWRSQSHGEMQGPGVAANNAKCIAQENHQLLKGSVACKGSGFSASRFDGCDAALLTRTLIQNTAQSQVGVNLLAERAVALGGPALRTPSSGRTQHDVAVYV